jgi:hypothetical protein
MVVGSARAAIHILHWDATSREFVAQMSASDQLALKMFPYPAWRILVNGQAVEPSQREGTGQLIIPVKTGTNEVRIRFVRTWDRTLGGWISLVSVILLVSGFLLGDRVPRLL